jgi:hypothetical protein
LAPSAVRDWHCDTTVPKNGDITVPKNGTDFKAAAWHSIDDNPHLCCVALDFLPLHFTKSYAYQF